MRLAVAVAIDPGPERRDGDVGDLHGHVLCWVRPIHRPGAMRRPLPAQPAVKTSSSSSQRDRVQRIDRSRGRRPRRSRPAAAAPACGSRCARRRSRQSRSAATARCPCVEPTCAPRRGRPRASGPRRPRRPRVVVGKGIVPIEPRRSSGRNCPPPAPPKMCTVPPPSPRPVRPAGRGERSRPWRRWRCSQASPMAQDHGWPGWAGGRCPASRSGSSIASEIAWKYPITALWPKTRAGRRAHHPRRRPAPAPAGCSTRRDRWPRRRC